MITPSAHISAMKAYPLTDLSVAPGKRLISLSQNESAMPPSPGALAAGRDAMGEATLYSDSNWTELTQAIARIHNIPTASILCGAGSMELIACIAQCYAGPGRDVLSSAYAYAYFRTATLMAGAAYDVAPENNLTVSVDALLTAVRPQTRIVFVANPGNPSGTWIPPSELSRLRDGLHDDVVLVIDEAYGEFADGLARAPGETTFDLVERGNTVVLRTFSKAYSLAGCRVGWGIFPPEIASEIRKVLNPNNISGPSQAAATAAMLDQDYMHAVCAETTRLRHRFTDQMRQLGLAVPDSQTNFILIRFPDTGAAERADAALRTDGILLRGMAGYGLPDCLRATISAKDDMNLTADILQAWHEKEPVAC